MALQNIQLGDARPRPALPAPRHPRATPLGAAAKFATAGKETGKKDFGLHAMSYGHIYVARIAFGAKINQTAQALLEAEAYPEVQRALRLSDSSELPLRLRWLAILSGRLKASLIATGGIHTALDAVKAVMAGAHAVQMVSALLKRGPEYLRLVPDEMARWMTEHGPDPAAYERANYIQILQSWRAPAGW